MKYTPVLSMNSMNPKNIFNAEKLKSGRQYNLYLKSVNRMEPTYGNFLSIDLSSGKDTIINLDPEIIRAFIGGKGIGAYLLFKMLKPKTNPLSPDNILMFLTGPFTGTSYPTSGRMVVVTKSPLTGLYLDSHAGGSLGPEIRYSGYDGIIIKGKASSPVYVWLNDNKIEIRDANKFWGLTISETVKKIRKETDPLAHIATIGPAGENLVKFAAIMIDSDDDPWRAGIAARGGTGAVMGSKNLKAIAVKAKRKRIRYANSNKAKNVFRKAFKLIDETRFMKIRRAIGTSFWVEPMNRFGILPTRNFSRGYLDDATGLYGEYLRAFVKRDVACYNCPIACGKVVRLGNDHVKVEYEDLALLGSNCLIDDAIKVAKSLRIVNEMGLDAISTGNVIAFAMELKELGLLKDVPSFGDHEGQKELIKKIAHREGIGNLLAEGVARVSRKIGGRATEIAMHVKGMELPGYLPQTSWGMALAYATSDRGGCHQRAWTTRAEIEGGLERFSTEGIAKFVKETQDERAAAFSLIVCDFIPLYRPWEAFESITGIELSEKDYLIAGERIWNLARIFNIREAGINRKDDTLPLRVFNEPLPLPPDGKFNVILKKEYFDKMLNEYYELREWDSKGIPREDIIKKLGLTRLLPGILNYIS